MTNQIQNPNDGNLVVRFGCLIGATLAGCVVCWWAAGFSLGLFFGGFFIATFLLPAAVLEQTSVRRTIAGFVVIVGIIAGFWVVAIFTTADTVGQVLQTIVVLGCFGLAVTVVALALERVRTPSIFAAAVAIILGLAWLSWPVWLSPALARGGMDGVIRALVAVHPPLVANGILTAEAAWTERSVAYHLTNLNQDVPIAMPSNGLVCAAVHGVLGLVLWVVALARRGVLQTPPVRLQ